MLQKEIVAKRHAMSLSQKSLVEVCHAYVSKANAASRSTLLPGACVLFFRAEARRSSQRLGFAFVFAARRRVNDASQNAKCAARGRYAPRMYKAQ